MNPTKIGRGKSFKGVVAYLMQGERGAEIAERAQWMATQNIGTQNPYMAARVMAASALDADALKRANGWDGRGRGTTKEPVLHLSMSWHEDYHPDAAHQEQAARDMLKAMGLEQAQAVMVGHNDNEKTHLHIVVNVLDPDTGKQFSLSNDNRKMQAFALEYCRAHGMEHLAPNREKNAAKRDAAKREAGKAIELEGAKRLSRDEWRQMRAELLDRQAKERDALKAAHGEQWDKVKADRLAIQKAERAQWRQTFEDQKARLRAEKKGEWRDLFRQQKEQLAGANYQIELAARRVMRSHTVVGKVLGAIGLATRAFDAENQLAIAKMQKASMQQRHEAHRKEKAQAQTREAIERTREAVRLNPTKEMQQANTAALKRMQEVKWKALRARQDEERRKAGINHVSRPKTREQENRQQPRSPEQPRAKPAQERTKPPAPQISYSFQAEPSVKPQRDQQAVKGKEDDRRTGESRLKEGRRNSVLTEQALENRRKRQERDRRSREGRDNYRGRER